MERFSDDLRRERERQGVSLEAMCQITKVSQRHLRELETGDFASLPGGVFRKGILRSYLATLHLDAAPWVERFEQCLAELERPADPSGTIEVFAENISRNRAETVREPVRWPGVLAMLLLLIVFGWCVWRFALKGHVVLTHHRPASRTVILPLYFFVDIPSLNRLTQGH